MKLSLLSCLMLLTTFSSSGQKTDTWTAFWNNDTTLFGYKDKKGIVKIQPKFNGLTIANKFDDIIAAEEKTSTGQVSYYLTKSGRIIGRDSLHFYDNGADCESEGFIRFHDRKTDKVGMFNRDGNIGIPAEYNELAPVRNGMIVAIKGAVKKTSGEHYFWKGGSDVLIDTNNQVLINDFKYFNELDFYSVIISTQPSEDTLRINFKGTNGMYYSFIVFEKEFRSWLKTSLLDHFSKNQLLACTYDTITFWRGSDKWVSESKFTFLNRNFELLREILLDLNSKDRNYTIFSETLSPYMFIPSECGQYYNNCFESKSWQYPVENIVISYTDNKSIVQNQLEFLRTTEGYKLIDISINKGKIK